MPPPTASAGQTFFVHRLRMLIDYSPALRHAADRNKQDRLLTNRQRQQQCQCSSIPISSPRYSLHLSAVISADSGISGTAYGNRDRSSYSSRVYEQT